MLLDPHANGKDEEPYARVHFVTLKILLGSVLAYLYTEHRKWNHKHQGEIQSTNNLIYWQHCFGKIDLSWNQGVSGWGYANFPELWDALDIYS